MIWVDVTLWQYALAALAGLATGVIGGIAGYGSGLLLPLVLVPVMGAEMVVPIISVVTMFSNSTRAAAFWSDLDHRKAWTTLDQHTGILDAVVMIGGVGLILQGLRQ